MEENTNTNQTSGSTGKIIGYIVLAVLIIGGIFWYMNSKTSTGTPENGAMAENTTGAPTSLRALLAGGSQQCTFADNSTTDASTEGTVYVANGKMRGDFTSTAAGNTSKAHMIMDGTTMYTWIDGMNTGFKMTVSATAGSNTSANKSLDLDKPANVHCTPWVSDTTKFQLPAGLTFTDMAAMQTSTGANTGTSAQCGYCDQLPTDQKAQCRAALKC